MTAFWTEKRLDALSRTCLTLFQAFAIAAAIGGVLDKISNPILRIVFIIVAAGLLVTGVVFADKLPRKDR